MIKIRMMLASVLAIFMLVALSLPAQATGYSVYHHSPDAGASGAFVLQKADGSIVYAGQGQSQSNIVKWYVPAGENIACQQSEGVGPFVVVFAATGWHNVIQNWNSCVTQLD